MENLEQTIEQILLSITSDSIIDEETLQNTTEGISLLGLKNESLLSYISNLLLLAAAQLQHDEETFAKARSRSIEQRVTLEKGIKGLEAKISYQIDKALRSYKRSIEQPEQQRQEKSNKNGKSRNSNVGSNSYSASDSDSDSEIEATSFRPNISSMQYSNGMTSNNESRHNSYSKHGTDDAENQQKYVAPRISLVAPASEKQKSRSAPRRRDFAMEEYIRDSAEAPTVEPSIGSQIMDFGRGGERTERERRKDREIQDYEESNFTRISNTSSKRARKDAAQRQRNATSKSFFGEDWGFLDGEQKKPKRPKTRR